MTDLQQPLFLHMARRPFQRWPGSILLFTFILSVFPFINPPQSSATLIKKVTISTGRAEPLNYTLDTSEYTDILNNLGELSEVSFPLGIEKEEYNVELFSTTLSDINPPKPLTFDQYNPNFKDAVSLLTDNFNDHIGYKFVTPMANISYGTSEAMLFYEDGTGNSGIDFSGFQIDKLRLSVTDLWAETYLNSSDVPWIRVSANYTLRIYGSQGTAPVPEPATALLMGTGFSILALRRRKLNK